MRGDSPARKHAQSVPTTPKGPCYNNHERREVRSSELGTSSVGADRVAFLFFPQPAPQGAQWGPPSKGAPPPAGRPGAGGAFAAALPGALVPELLWAHYTATRSQNGSGTLDRTRTAGR